MVERIDERSEDLGSGPEGAGLAAGPRRALLAAAALVLVLRLAVGAQKLTGVGVDLEAGVSVGLWLALGALGLGYLACGLLALTRVRSRASALFAGHALCQAIHWGGPPAVPGETAQTAVWLLYFTLSMLGTSALLHFALVYPEAGPAPLRRRTRVLLYVPVALALALAVAWVLVPAGGPGARALIGLFFAFETLQVNLFALAALVVVGVRYTRARRRRLPTAGLGVILAGMLLGPLPWGLALAAEKLAPGIELPGGAGSQPYVLFLVLTPLAIAYALAAAPTPTGQATPVPPRPQ